MNEEERASIRIEINLTPKEAALLRKFAVDHNLPKAQVIKRGFWMFIEYEASFYRALLDGRSTEDAVREAIKKRDEKYGPRERTNRAGPE